MSDKKGPADTGAGSNTKAEQGSIGARAAAPANRKRLFRGGRDGAPGATNRRSRFLPLVTLLALILALAGTVGAAYLWFFGSPHTRQLSREVHHLHHRLSSQADELRQQGQALGRIGNLSDTQNKLVQRTQAQANELSALDQQMSSVQKNISQLNDLVQGGREVWLLDEVEELLLTANDRLALRGDAPAALQALQIAQRRLGQISDPRLIGVRKRLADEITSLQALPKLDVQGMALTLSSLAGRVRKLPLKQDLPRNYHAANGGAGTASASLPWWQRLGLSIAGALKGLVEVRNTNQRFRPMLPPKETYFLYQNLELKLESARLALLQRNNGVFHNSIQTARNWLKTYFKPGAPGVQAMTHSLQDMQQKNLQPQMPDIGGSLAALRHDMQAMGGGRDVQFKPAGAASRHGGKSGDSGR